MEVKLQMELLGKVPTSEKETERSSYVKIPYLTLNAYMWCLFGGFLSEPSLF